MNKLLIIVLSAAAAACGPTRGYQGPELPPERISQIRFESPASISFHKRIVDGIEASRGGIDVLPDVHEFAIEASVRGEPQNCRINTSFNGSGYAECQKKNSYCDCYSYLSIYKNCVVPVWPAVCGGRFSSQPGKTYDIGVHLEGSRVRARTADRAAPEAPAYAPCSVGALRWENSSDYLGTGQVTAIQNGVTGCGYW